MTELKALNQEKARKREEQLAERERKLKVGHPSPDGSFFFIYSQLLETGQFMAIK